MGLVAPLPLRNLWPGKHRAVRGSDHAQQAVLDILPQPLVPGQLRLLRPLGHQVGLPLRDRGPVLESAPTCGCVAPQFPGDRRGCPAQPFSNLPYPNALHTQQSDLLPLGERQVAARDSKIDLRHPASMPEPPRPHRRRCPDSDRRILTGQPLGDLKPEQSLDLPPRRRPPRRLHRRPPSQLRHPTRWPSHNTPL